MGWLIGAFTLSYAAFEIPTGMLRDRIGPRKVLTRIVSWWSVFTALTGAASSLGMLLVVRFLFGAGEAGAFPNCASVIGRWFPGRERARAMSMFWMATAIGGAIAPLERITKRGKMAAGLYLEGGFDLDGNLGVIRTLYRLGFRSAAIVRA